jgi:hypothetical protein
MITYKVWLAAETLLYLPIYALGDLGILARVANTAGLGDDIALEILPAPEPGDTEALRHMLAQAAKAPSSEVHIAIADPVAAVMADRKGKEVLLLGAFLKRPPFWVAGRDVPAGYGEIEHRYIYYRDGFETGQFLGQQLSAELDASHKRTCAMGEEFEIYLGETEDIPGRVQVISADLSGLIACLERDPTVKIQRHLAPDYRDFLTTGILTHRQYEASQARALAVFLEAVRSSCVLLRTAEKPAAALIHQLLETGAELRPAVTELDNGERLDNAVLAKKIATRIFEDSVYSDTLEVEFSEWRAVINSRRWKDKRSALRAFGRIYEPRASRALTGDWLIRTFSDYGRFVKQGRALKGGLIGCLVALVLSQVVLRGFETAAGDEHSKLLLYASISSAFVATTALLWGVVALLRHRTRAFFGLQMMFLIDENAAHAVVFALAGIVATLPVYWVTTSIFGDDLDWGALVLFVVPTTIGLISAAVTLVRKRHA